jgi:hypothetical protein
MGKINIFLISRLQASPTWLGSSSRRPGMTHLKATGSCPGFALGPRGHHNTTCFISVSCQVRLQRHELGWARSGPARHDPLARYRDEARHGMKIKWIVSYWPVRPKAKLGHILVSSYISVCGGGVSVTDKPYAVSSGA